MVKNKKLRVLLLALLATITCGAVAACGEEPSPTPTLGSSTSEVTPGSSEEGPANSSEEGPADSSEEGPADSSEEGPADSSEEGPANSSEEEEQKYTIQFVNHDGTVLQSGEVTEGTLPEYGGDEPTKAADAQYTYTFSGWDKQIAVATDNAIYTAQFSGTVNKYDVEFYNGEEIVYIAEQVSYGEVPTYEGEALTKYGLGVWKFAGWGQELSAVDGTNLAYYANFEKLYGYNVVAVVDGAVTETSADYWGDFNKDLGMPCAGIQAETTYRFTVEGVDFTQYDTVTLPIAVNYVGMKVTAPNGETIATTLKNQVIKISVDKSGNVYVGNNLAEGATMTNGVFSFDVTRGAEDTYASLTYGSLAFNEFTPPAPKVFVRAADNPVAANTNFTMSDVTETQTPAKGFEKTTQIDVASWTNGFGAAISLNDYTEVKFAIKTSNGEKFYSFLCGGVLVGTTEWGNNNTEWLTISLVKNADAWDVYFDGVLKKAGCSLDGTSLDACNFQFADSTYYVSEVRGVKIEKNYTIVAEQIFAPSNGTTTVADATDEEDKALGISKITTASITGWGNPTLSDVQLGAYSEYKFYIKRSSTGDIYQGGSDWQTHWAYQLIADQWAEVVLVKNAAGTYDVIVSGAKKQVKDLEPISNLNELSINCTKEGDAGVMYVSNLMGLVEAE